MRAERTWWDGNCLDYIHAWSTKGDSLPGDEEWSGG